MLEAGSLRWAEVWVQMLLGEEGPYPTPTGAQRPPHSLVHREDTASPLTVYQPQTW